MEITALILVLCILVLSSCCIAESEANGPIVHLDKGTVQGQWGISYKNRTFSEFYGVPYAEPPTRFKIAEEVKPWPGVLRANRSTSCPCILNNAYLGDEDCLYLNIQVPSDDPESITKKLPVLVHLHAGAFMFANGASYTGPLYLMDRDIILVSINYRHNALGFLSLLDEVLPGNLGLKDQVQALRWIQENIEKFGGDPKRVTISGLSAGGASVHYHYLSKVSRGLFNNGISSSGTALDCWAQQEAPKEKARILGERVGCALCSSEQFVECLRTKPARKIVEAAFEFEAWMGLPFSPFAPVVEPPNPTAFLTKPPVQIMLDSESLNAPWLLTGTTLEGLYPTAEFLNDNATLPELEMNWDKYCPYLFDFNYTVPVANHSLVCDKIKDFYLNGQPVSRDNFLGLARAASDRLFAVTLEKTAKLQAATKSKPVYVYKYDYVAETQRSFAEYFSIAPKQGVCHGDDMVMIYSNPVNPLRQLSKKDELMTEILMDIFVSFASNGKPTTKGVKWLPAEDDLTSLRVLFIEDPYNIDMLKKSTFANDFFWDSISFEENEKLV